MAKVHPEALPLKRQHFVERRGLLKDCSRLCCPCFQTMDSVQSLLSIAPADQVSPGVISELIRLQTSQFQILRQNHSQLFDIGNRDHVEMLLRFGRLMLGGDFLRDIKFAPIRQQISDAPQSSAVASSEQKDPCVDLLTLRSSRWLELGFQNPLPLSDFRASGYLCLRHMLFGAQKASVELSSMCDNDDGGDSESQSKFFPLALASMHCSLAVLKLFKLSPPVQSNEGDDDALPLSMSSSRWLKWLLMCDNVEAAVSAIQLTLLMGVHRCFVNWNCTYFQFNSVLIVCTQQLEETILAKHEPSLHQCESEDISRVFFRRLQSLSASAISSSNA